MAIQSSAHRPLDFTLLLSGPFPVLRNLFGLDLPLTVKPFVRNFRHPRLVTCSCHVSKNQNWVLSGPSVGRTFSPSQLLGNVAGADHSSICLALERLVVLQNLYSDSREALLPPTRH